MSRQSNDVIDSCYSWWILVVAIISNMLESSIFFSSTIYMVHWQHAFDVTTTELGIVGSLMSAVSCFSALFVGPLIARHGCRPVAYAGAIVSSLGFMTSAIATSISWLIVTYGLIVGVGSSLAGLPTMICVQYYFNKHRPFAVGVAGMGASIGILVGMPLLQLCCDVYGWRGALLLHGGLVLQILVLASFFRPVDVSSLDDQNIPMTSLSNSVQLIACEVNTNDEICSDDLCVVTLKEAATDDVEDATNTKTHESLLKKQKAAPDSHGRCRDKHATGGMKHASGGLKHVPEGPKDAPGRPRQDSKNMRTETSHGTRATSRDTMTIDTCKSRVFSFIRNTWNFSLLRNVCFLLYVLNSALGEYVIACMYRFTPLRAIEDGVSEQHAAFLPSCIATCSFTFRLIGSIIANMRCTNRYVQCGVAMLCQGVVACSSALAYDVTTYALNSAAYGVFVGLEMGVLHIVMTDIVGVASIAQANAFLLPVLGLALMTSLPAAGFLIDVTGSFDTPFYAFGLLVCVPGVIFLCMPKIMQTQQKENATNDDGEISEMERH